MRPISGAGQAARVNQTEPQPRDGAGPRVTNVTQSAETMATGAAASLKRSDSNVSTGTWASSTSVHGGTLLDSTLAEMPFVMAKFIHWPKPEKTSYEVTSQPRGAGEATAVGKSLIADFAQEALPTGVRRAAIKAFVE
ncbi:MAG: hypothetical protein ACRC7P_06995, partial [Enterovibrio sp.]